MPLLLDYTDRSGVGHEASYWRLSSIVSIDREEKKASFVLVGYHNKQCYESGLSPIHKEQIVIENKIVKRPRRENGETIIDNIPVNDFDDYLGTEKLDLAGENPYRSAYLYAKEKIKMFENSSDVDI